MNNIKVWIFLDAILFFKMIYSETNIHDKLESKNLFNGKKGDNTSSAAELPTLTITEPRKLIVTMESNLMVTLNYSIPCNNKQDLFILQTESDNTELFILKGNTTFEVSCRDAEEIDIYLHEENAFVNNESDKYVTNITSVLAATGSIKLHLHGVLLGLSQLYVRLKRYDGALTVDVIETIGMDVTESVNSTEMIERRFDVGILRVRRPIDNIFIIVIAFFISIIIIGFGCGLDLEVVKECLKKPIAPGIGLGCQYILMPLLGFAVAKLVPIENQAISFGIFVCGVCPGGGASNIYTYLLGGDVSLSVTMTLISSVAALAMMPFWVYTLGRQFLEEDFQVIIPYTNMLQTLAMITIPLFIGVFIKFKFPKFAIKFLKVLKPATIIMMIVFVSIGIYSNLYIFKLVRPEYVLAGGLLPYCGYLAGGTIAAILQQPWTRVKTIALETGMQNFGVAFFLVMTSFPPPLGDIAALAPASSAMATPIPPMLVAIPYLIYKRCTRTHEPVTVLSDGEIGVVKNGDIHGEIEIVKNGDIIDKKANDHLLAVEKGVYGNDEHKPMI